MCGIAGFVGQGDEKTLKRMTEALKHRGPDDEGFFIKENISLGHRRLSIIDLPGGRQPIWNEDKTVVIIFNGEIYNFQELKEQLQRKNHRFYTKSDTEVLVHLYEDKKEDFLKVLNGMFALALWDEREKKLILARDRFGEKPLYYALSNRTLIFASELKAIITHPAIKKVIDFCSLAKYLIYEYVPSPWTIFKNIYKIKPGEYLVYREGVLKKERYWDIKFSSNVKSQMSNVLKKEHTPPPFPPPLRGGGKGGGADIKIPRQELLRELEAHLERAVKMRLISDVPLGIWLSGGLDSTTIAYYAQKNSAEPVKTFSIGFDEPSFDESRYFRKAANFLKTEHYEKFFTAKDFLTLIPQIGQFLDEPLGDASLLPTYLLAAFTREKVKVALAGDGGDELFMGYPTFPAHKLAKIYDVLPSFLRRRIISPLINSLPVSFGNISLDFKLKRFISGLGEQPEIRDQLWLGSFQPKVLKELLSEAVFQEIAGKDIFEDIKNKLKEIQHEPQENRLIYLYLKNYLAEDILVKTDRASMACGLEVRAPFLDERLADFVNSLPPHWKLRGLTSKYLLKKLMADKIPKEIVKRSKKGFGMPIAKWIREELKDWTLTLFEPAKIKREAIFNFSYINQLLQEHFSGKKDHRKLLWTLMVFEMWLEKWGK